MSNPSPVVACRRKITCPLCSPPSTAPDASISSSTYRSPTGAWITRDPLTRHRAEEPEVRHHRADHDVALERAVEPHRDRARREDLVAVDHVADGIGEQRPVGVAVEREARLRAAADHLGGDDLGVQRAAAVVDVRAVGLGVDRRSRGRRAGAGARARSTRPRRSRSRRRVASRPGGAARRPRGARGSARAPPRRARGRSRPRSAVGAESSIAASISSSIASGSFVPAAEKNLIPLSSGGLWDAEITTPLEAPRSVVRNATAGVGSMPASRTSPPAAVIPARARPRASSPEARGSRPTTIAGWPSPWRPKTATAAAPSRAGEVVGEVLPRAAADAVGPEQPRHRAAPYRGTRRPSPRPVARCGP